MFGISFQLEKKVLKQNWLERKRTKKIIYLNEIVYTTLYKPITFCIRWLVIVLILTVNLVVGGFVGWGHLGYSLFTVVVNID